MIGNCAEFPFFLFSILRSGCAAAPRSWFSRLIFAVESLGFLTSATILNLFRQISLLGVLAGWRNLCLDHLRGGPFTALSTALAGSRWGDF